MEERLGDSRLGGDSVFGNLGVTILMASGIFICLILLVLLLIFLCRRCNSEKFDQKAKMLRQKFFFNPLIRYVMLNSLKLNMVALVVVTKQVQDFALAVTLLVTINIAPIVFYFILKRNADRLANDEVRKEIGTLYIGRDVDNRGYQVRWLPLMFFSRRSLFICTTVLLLN